MRGMQRGQPLPDILRYYRLTRQARRELTVLARPTLINLAQPAPAGPFRKRPPPEPNSKASSSSSNTLKRARRISGSRSRSPVKAGRLDLSAAEVVSNGSESAQMDEEQDDVLEELGENG